MSNPVQIANPNSATTCYILHKADSFFNSADSSYMLGYSAAALNTASTLYSGGVFTKNVKALGAIRNIVGAFGLGFFAAEGAGAWIKDQYLGGCTAETIAKVSGLTPIQAAAKMQAYQVAKGTIGPEDIIGSNSWMTKG